MNLKPAVPTRKDTKTETLRQSTLPTDVPDLPIPCGFPFGLFESFVVTPIFRRWDKLWAHGIVSMIVMLLASERPALAELPLIRLTSVFPAGGRSGTTFEITAAGIDLDDATNLLFSAPGISALPKLRPNSTRPEPNKFVVTIASEIAPTVCEVRMAGRFGISNPRAFTIGQLTEVIEPGGNNSVTSALAVALGTTVNGRAAATAIDHFRITARKGQRILLECRAREIDSRMDPVLAILDSLGHELERSRRSGLLDFTAPADGDYFITLHDFLYRGGEDYFYRLSCGTGPRLDFVFPPAGLPGSKSTFTLYGRNLPGGVSANLKIDGKPLEQITAEIELPNDPELGRQFSLGSPATPASSVLDGITYRLRATNGVSNPLFIGLAAEPIVPEREPNDLAGAAQRISVPCEYVGQFYPAGDRDWVTFEAKKGETYWIEVISQRAGLSTDPFLLLQRAAKNEKSEERISDVKELYDAEVNLGGVEFNTSSRDPLWRFAVSDSGQYRVQVRDLFNTGPSRPGLTYRLSIRREQPDFRLVVLSLAPPPASNDTKEVTLWTPFLRRGETIPLKVLAFRRDDFNGEIRLSIEGLPASVHGRPVTLEANQTSATLLLTADEQAPEWRGPITVIGTAQAGSGEITRRARTASVVWTVPDTNNEVAQSRMTHNLMLAISGKETIPIRLEGEGKDDWETSLAGKLEIPILVERRGDFGGDMKLKPAGPPALEAAPEFEIKGSTNRTTLVVDLTKTKLPIGTHLVYLRAQAKGKYRRLTPEEVAAAEAAVKAADANLKLAEQDVVARTAQAKAISQGHSEADQAAAARAVKAAEEKKEAAIRDVGAAKDTAQRAEAKEVNATLLSRPLILRVTAAPIRWAGEWPAVQLAAGAKFEIPVVIARLYGFSDAVELSLTIPKEAGSLTAAKATLAQEETKTKIILEAGQKVSPGRYDLRLQATVKLNQQDLKIEQPLTVTVVAADRTQPIPNTPVP